MDAYRSVSVHSAVARSLRQTKSASFSSGISSSISVVDKIQDSISGRPEDAPIRNSFSLSFASVLIGGTLDQEGER